MHVKSLLSFLFLSPPIPVSSLFPPFPQVCGGSLVLGGADIVDGSPVLDIKPYVPFCDGLSDASAPAWVTAEADDEPLRVRSVRVAPEATALLERCWRGHKGRSLYKTGEEFIELVKQVGWRGRGANGFVGPANHLVVGVYEQVGDGASLDAA